MRLVNTYGMLSFNLRLVDGYNSEMLPARLCKLFVPQA